MPTLWKVLESAAARRPSPIIQLKYAVNQIYKIFCRRYEAREVCFANAQTESRGAYLQTLTYHCINKDIPINPQLREKFQRLLVALFAYMLAHGHTQGLVRLLDICALLAEHRLRVCKLRKRNTHTFYQ